jgi:hypothetical protein
MKDIAMAKDEAYRDLDRLIERDHSDTTGLEQFSNGFSRKRDVECGDLSPLSVIGAKKAATCRRTPKAKRKRNPL